jgi:SAM-dependent methyltransferase
MFPLLEPPEPCPVCADQKARPLHVYRNKARRTSPRPYLALVGCERCGLVRTHPLPTEADLGRYYGGAQGWEARDGGDGADSGPELDEKLERKRAKYARERDLLAPWLPSTGPRRAFDFGAGVGSWLDVLQEDGWETWGLEPGPGQREIAGRRHRMVEELPGGERFDLVVANHVVEHLRDPRTVLRSLAALTAPGGQLFVSVPDLGRLAEHGKLKYVTSDVHICSYTFSAMSSLLGLAGFRVLAHFDGREWDELAPLERARLKVLAESTGEPVEPQGEPLTAAIEALRAHARQQLTGGERAARPAAGAGPEQRSRFTRSLVTAVRSRLGRGDDES